MKTAFLFVFGFFVVPVFGQDADSLAVVREVDSLIQVSHELTGKREFDKALEISAEAEKTALEKLGRESAKYGKCCVNHGRVLYFKRDYPEAEKWWLNAKAIREKVLGKEHSDYAASLHNLAALYYAMGQYEKAVPLNLEGKGILEKVLGKEHPDYAASLNNLAILYETMGQFDKAEPLNLEAKGIQEKVLGKESPHYVRSLNNLAILYWKMGQYEKAEPLYLEAKAIVEKILGKEHSKYAASLNNLAGLYQEMGQYEKAELLHFEAKVILEKVPGKESPEYAGCLSNLAALFNNMGQYEKAELLHLEAKAIRKKVLGEEHPDYAASLNNLAILYEITRQFDKAIPIHLEAKAIKEKTLGKEHPDYAVSLNGLAALYSGKSQYEKAEPLYLETKAIMEKALGKEHPIYAASLINLGTLYDNMDQYDKAEPLYLEAKAILEKALGKEHPDYVGSLNNLAVLYNKMGQYEKAEHLCQELSAANYQLIEKATLHLSERELSHYLNTFFEEQDWIFSFAQSSGSKKLAPVCYDNSLFYKGFLLQAVNQVKQLACSDSASAEKYNLLKSYARRLATEYSKPIAERDSAKVAVLEEKANELEKDLARTVAGYGRTKRQVTWQEVQAVLKPGEAAVEFMHFRYFDPKATDSTMYTVLILQPGQADPALIPLFEERSLGNLLSPYGERKTDYVNQLYTIAKRGAKPLDKPKKSLYELLWQPLEKHLAGVKTIYYSPSGLMHRLNLAAIPIGIDSVLGDRYQLVELGSTRQLVVPTTVRPAANDAVLFGGVQYDSDSTAILQASAALNPVSVASRGELSFTYTDSTLRTGAWSDLPFTEREISGIERIMKTAGIQTQARRGYAATEEAFKSIGAGTETSGSPRILHIATHGFFFPDPKELRNAVPMPRDGLRIGDEPVFKISDHPMIRSGLILAGGNHAWATGKPIKPGMEDGILTAYEISQMNLSNTELVVLSACETGLGDIQGNEGVYGLQRAFKIAGAKYLIMSLWQVPDRQTSLLMTTFYKKWLEEKMEIPDAFRAAQRELREAGLDPYQWAGFVLVE